MYPPRTLLLRPHHTPLFNIEEALSEGVVDIDGDLLILVLSGRVGLRAVCLDEFPNVILCDVVGVVGAARDLIENPAFGNLDFMSVQVIFGLDVAEDEGLRKGVRLSQRVDPMQRLVENVQLLFLHLHDAPHEH